MGWYSGEGEVNPLNKDERLAAGQFYEHDAENLWDMGITIEDEPTRRLVIEMAAYTSKAISLMQRPTYSGYEYREVSADDTMSIRSILERNEYLNRTKYPMEITTEQRAVGWYPVVGVFIQNGLKNISALTSDRPPFVESRLKYESVDDAIRLSIIDSGPGYPFEPEEYFSEQQGEHFGLYGMSLAAKYMQANLSVERISNETHVRLDMMPA